MKGLKERVKGKEGREEEEEKSGMANGEGKGGPEGILRKIGKSSYGKGEEV